jgi:DNA repair exonuclease SbcCD nuclease subunit
MSSSKNPKKQKQLNKMLLFTDYHVGKSRDLFYTTNTLEYMEWLVSLVEGDPTIDSIGFLGDWHESRSHIHVDTLNLSYKLATRLNNLGLPIYFVVGNHDLFNKHSRDIHSCVFFNKFENFTIIDQPTIFPEFDKSALFSPYLFHNEYDFCLLKQPASHLLGHFEFKDFVITGYNTKMDHGPDAQQLSEYISVLSGHFHKRQTTGNVTYIGNTFPTSFADANDTARGACVYQFDTGQKTYHNWMGGPRYYKTTLSELASGKVNHEVNEKTFVRCMADTHITYEEHNILKDMFIKQLGIKSLAIEEDKTEAKQILGETLSGISQDELTKSTVDELVHKMLSQIAVEKIDNKALIEIYKTL